MKINLFKKSKYDEIKIQSSKIFRLQNKKKKEKE